MSNENDPWFTSSDYDPFADLRPEYNHPNDSEKRAKINRVKKYIAGLVLTATVSTVGAWTQFRSGNAEASNSGDIEQVTEGSARQSIDSDSTITVDSEAPEGGVGIGSAISETRAINEIFYPETVEVQRKSPSISVDEVIPDPALSNFNFADTDYYGVDPSFFCTVNDVEVPVQLLKDRIEAGSRIERVFDIDQVNEIKQKIAEATTIEQIQNITRQSFENLPIEVVFDQEVNWDEVPVAGGVTLDYYKQYISNVITGLSAMPTAMVGNGSVERINITSSDFFEHAGIDRYGANFIESAKQINLTSSIDTVSLIHEFAHAIHQKACMDIGSDIIFEDVYNQAIELMNQMGVDLFPGEYSQSNYAELFAEMSADLLTGGFLDQLDSAERVTPEAIALQKLVIERMQQAMPEINMVDYLQYLDSVKYQLPWEISAQEAEAAKISSFDVSYIENYQNHDVELTPAVAIVDAEGNTEFIYAATTTNEDGTKTVTIKFNAIESNPDYQAVYDAVQAYISVLIRQNTNEVTTDRYGGQNLGGHFRSNQGAITLWYRTS